MRLRLPLSSVGCVVLSLFLLGAAAQDVRVNFGVAPDVGAYFTDDDTPLVVGLVAPGLSKVSFTGQVTVTVRASPPNDPALRAAKLVDSFNSFPGDYTLLPLEDLINATSGSVDTFEVTFSQGSDFSSNFTIQIISDNVFEGIEYFTLEIVSIKEPDGFPASIKVGTRSKVTVTMLDTDVLTIAFTERSVVLKEGESVQLEGVAAMNPFSVEVEVGVQCLELIGTGARPATRDKDFKIARNATLTFDGVDLPPPIGSSANPSVHIEEDSLVEGTEAFLCVLAISVSPGQPLQSSDPDTITITILDVDELVVEWDDAHYSVAEGDGEVKVQLVARGRYEIAFFLQGEPRMAQSTVVGGRNFGLAVASSGGLTGDFVSSVVSFNFPANVATPTMVSAMSFTVVDDDVLEEDEVFEGIFVIPVQVSNQINIQRGPVQVTSIIIEDNDVIEVSFAKGSYTAAESSGSVALQLRVDGRYNIDFQVEVECRDTDPVSAQAGADYLAGTHTVNVSRPDVPESSSYKQNFPNVTFTDPVTVTIISDGVLEKSEDFECCIVSTSHTRVLIGSRGSVPVTIVDQDTVSVHFSHELYRVNESSGPAELELVLEGKAAIPVTVAVGTLELTNSSTRMGATAMDDYTAVNSQDVVFQPGQTTSPFTVDIVSDQLPELSEFFNVTLTTSQPCVALSTPSLAQVEIVDDDSFVTISFDAVTYDVIEGEMMAKVCVSLSAAYYQSVSVSLVPKAITGDPAVVATMSDFMATPTTLTIPAGSTAECAIVIVMDDSIVELDEDFEVFLTYTGNQQGVSLGSATVATVTIINDDTLQLAFARNQYIASEGTMLVVMVTASGMSSFDYNFTVVPSNQTAQENDDYVLHTRSFTYTGGTSGGDFTFVVEVLSDDTFEGSEQFELALSIDQTFQELGVALGNPSNATVTIEESDVLGVSFGVSALTITEGGSMELTVVANGTFHYPLNVTVQLVSGSAVDPADFVGGNFPVTLDPALQGGVLVISALRDNIIELPETFTASLHPPTTPGVVAVEPTTTTVTILDATMATVMFSSPMVGVTEGDTVTLQLVLSAEVAPGVSFSVNLTTTPGTATELVDYSPTIPPVLFTGTNVATFQVTTANDSVVEDTEEFTVHLVITQGAADLGVSPGSPNTTVVEINDNDVAKVFFTQSVYTVSEGNGSVSVTVMTSKPHSEAFEVIIKATSGSAQQLLDFVFVDEMVTFQPGEVKVTVQVLITEDLVMEMTESFTLFLEVPPATVEQKVTAGVPAEATVNILDNDRLLVSLTSPSTVTEGDTVNVTVVTTGAFAFPINVTLTLVDGTATSGVDFDVSGFPMTVTLQPDMTSVSVTVSTTTDNVIECPEDFQASLTIPTSSLNVGVVLGSPATVTVTIVDADAPLQVSFEDIAYQVSEGTMATITLVTSTPNYTFPFTVSLVYSDLTATSSVDYSPLPLSVAFAAGQERVSFQVDVLEDQVLELDEVFLLSVSSFSGECTTAVATAPDRDTANVTISNDDTVTVSLLGPATVTEGDNVTYTVDTIGEFRIPISVTLTLVDGTATGGDDFDVSGFPVTVTLQPGMTSVNVTVSTTSDGVIECTECFDAELGSPSHGVVLGSTTTLNTCILDADGHLQVSFGASLYDTTEGTAANITVVTSTPSYTFPFTVFLMYLDFNGISATMGVDYIPLPSNVTFQAGQRSLTFSVAIPDDQVAELPENFRVRITGYAEHLSCADGLVEDGGITTAFVRISDNDKLIVSLMPSVYMVPEGDSVTVTLVTNIPYSFGFKVTVEGSNGTATPGVDYDSGPKEVSFAASVTSPGSANTTFQTRTDNVFEGEEIFLLELMSNSDVGIGPDTGLVIIEDQTMVRLSFGTSSYVVAEGNHVTVTLESDVAIEMSFEVNVSTVEGTADAGADFTALTDVVVTFEPGTSAVSVNISTIDDLVAELDETLHVTFVIPSTEATVNVKTGSISRAKVFIEDNDALSVRFERPAYQVGEGDGVLEVAVVTNTPSEFSFRARITAMDGTATALTDYDVTGNVSTIQNIPPGSTRHNFSVNIIEDSTFEGNENFSLTLSVLNGGPLGITVAMPDVAVVTIVDNEDMVMVALEAQNYRVVEGVGFVEVCLNKTGPSTSSLTLMAVPQELDSSSSLIGSAAIDGIATGNDDFHKNPQMLTIAPAETFACFNITIIDDSLVELDELFQVLITSLPGQEGVESGEIKPVEFESVIRIIDDDDIKVTFEQPSYSVSESMGMVSIRVITGSNASFPYDVVVTSTNLTANDPSDFKFDSVTLTFNPGETFKDLMVFVEDDKDNLEPDEQFVLSLRVVALTGSTGEIESTTVNITDDKVVSVTFDPTTYTTNEGDILNVTLKASIPSISPYSVIVVNEDGTAKAPDDYRPIGPYTVTFAAGITMATISLVIPTDDLAEESKEEFELKISSVSDNRVVIGPEDVATVTVEDGDRPTVNFQPITYTVSEGEKVQLVLVLDKEPATTFVVEFMTEGVTANSPDDYSGGVFSVTFNPGSKTASSLVTVNPDNEVEGDMEQFTAKLFAGDAIIGTNDTALVTIVDATVAAVTFDPVNYTVNEGAAVVLMLRVTMMLDIAVNVTVSTVPVTADIDDFVSGTYNVTFGPGVMAANLSIMTHSDLMDEETELFQAVIVSTTLRNVVVGAANVANIAISDTTVLYPLSFEMEHYTVQEGKELSVFLIIESGVARPSFFRVEVEDNEGTALVGEDYRDPDTFANFQGGSTKSERIVVRTMVKENMKDEVVEMVENFTLHIVIPEDRRAEGVVLGSIPVATVQIIDDDIEDLVISYNRTEYLVREDEGPLEVVLLASRLASFEYSVTVTPTAVSANANEDFDPQPLTAVFAPGQRMASVFLEIVDNALVEQDESLTLQMDVSVDLINKGVSIQGNGQSTVTILDNDVEVLFDQAAYTANETEGYLILTIIARGDTSQSFVVTINTIDGTATSPSDFTPGPYTTVFLRKQTRADIQILISDDGVFEGPETFTVNLTLRSIDTRRATTVDPSQAEVTIFDGNGRQGVLLRRVNDTIVGDPLYTVPLQGSNLTDFPELVGVSLCYEFHGFSGKYYSVVSDACTAVNAHYAAGKNDPRLNVVSEIGVKTEGLNDTCHQIHVTVDQCQATVDGQPVSTMFSADGVLVMSQRNRVRVEVPNCATSRQLVMWVICEQRNGEDMIRFIVARGRGLTPMSHGLVAQFWNIPMEYKRYSGPFAGRLVTEAAGLYEVTVRYPGSPPRTFIGDLEDLTWEQNKQPCLYAGNSYAGRVSEAIEFDSVIEGEHTDYEVADIFAHDFTFDKYTSDC